MFARASRPDFAGRSEHTFLTCEMLSTTRKTERGDTQLHRSEGAAAEVGQRNQGSDGRRRGERRRGRRVERRWTLRRGKTSALADTGGAAWVSRRKRERRAWRDYMLGEWCGGALPRPPLCGQSWIWNDDLRPCIDDCMHLLSVCRVKDEGVRRALTHSCGGRFAKGKDASSRN